MRILGAPPDAKAVGRRGAPCKIKLAFRDVREVREGGQDFGEIVGLQEGGAKSGGGPTIKVANGLPLSEPIV